jgi:glycosyltransferase involved in cell wall biosynthesis
MSDIGRNAQELARLRRIAFLSPEFIADYPDGGGIGNYVHKMARALRNAGHVPEVFVTSPLPPGAFEFEGIRVERVPARCGRPLLEGARAVANTVRRPVHMRNYLNFLSASHALAGAMEARHREAPFDIVQSVDMRLTGIAVQRAPERVHLLRFSINAELHSVGDGDPADFSWSEQNWEAMLLRRVDGAYAPSAFFARHLTAKHGMKVGVVRPPAVRNSDVPVAPPPGLPPRFLIHFGNLIRRKGTAWLAEAIKRVVEVEPDFRMVWVGPGDPALPEILNGLGPARANVLALHPLPKALLYAVLQRAEAGVVPSRVDNLPNTAIECLIHGIPVIGTNGASIDELVTEGVDGTLVPSGDVDALAGALLRTWRGEGVRPGFVWQGRVASEMEEQAAVSALLSFADRARPQGRVLSRREVAAKA